MRIRFLYMSNEERLARAGRIAQEFHLPTDSMLVSDLIYLSDKVSAIWAAKKKCIEDGIIYVGG